MEFERLISGESHVLFAPSVRGSSTIESFVDAIRNSFLLNQCLALLQDFASKGIRQNSNKYGILGDGIFELKPGQYRFPFFYDAESVVVVTHGFEKKRQKTPAR